MNRRRRNPRLKPFANETQAARRSSLRVNLSYVSNLSDSGNGSLKKSQLETTKVAVADAPDDAPTNEEPEMAERAVAFEDGDLSVIRFRELALNRSCQLLKDAILHKTQEIFDGRAELSVRTADVLKAGRRVLKDINEDRRPANLPEKSSIASKNVSISIVPNPVGALAPKNTRFSNESILGASKKCSNVNDTVILTGSSKLHRKTLSKINEKVLRVRLTRMADPRLEISSDASQSTQSTQWSQSSISDDIGAPMTCSSFMSGHGNPGSRASQRFGSEGRTSDEESDAEAANVSKDRRSPKTLTPMEITAAQGQVFSTPKDTARNIPTAGVSSDAANRFGTSRNERSVVREVPMELTTIQSHIPSCRGSSSSGKTGGTSLNVNTSVNEYSRRSETKNVEEDFRVPENVDNRLSLRVNTSLGSQRRSSGNKSSGSKIVDDGNMERTSMGMKTKSVENSVEHSVENDADRMENMSLIARLRNISGTGATDGDNGTKSKRELRSSGAEGPSFVEGTPFPPSRSILWRTQLRLDTLNAVRNKTAKKAPTAIEAEEESAESSDAESAKSIEFSTRPKTAPRLIDSPCRFTSSSGDNRIIPDSSDEDEPMEVPTTDPKISEQSSQNISQERPNDFSQPIPKKLPNQIPQNTPKKISQILPTEISQRLSKKIEIPKPIEKVSRVRKKKLLPLCDNLELVSFSPVSPASATPKKSIVAGRKKNFQKRKAVRDLAAKRIESMCIEDNDEPGCSGIDNRRGIKKTTKKKKPRKIISKKFVVKKIHGKNLAGELENLRRFGQSDGSDVDSTNGRNSLDDFARKKIVPISGQKRHPRKLVIVATGFSKGDVDLVKRIVKELGNAEINSTVSRRTTHVVSTGVRTINLLRGIIRGCWLVSLEWVLKSLEKRKWLNAEQYEMIHFSKAVQENRKDRQLFGKDYLPELFATCGPIHIENGTTPPSGILKELVKTAGGRIAEDARQSKLIVGSEGLREVWILDSITTGNLQPIEDYSNERCRPDGTNDNKKKNRLRGTQIFGSVYSLV